MHGAVGATGNAQRRPRALADRTRRWADNPVLLALLLLAVALAARCAQFGNPVVQVDDEFYLLVGDRMLHGAPPFVDIWDRKPVGLFLLYAGMRALGGDGVLAYQLVATVFAAATGFVIARTARRMTGAHGAAAAGVVYILYLGVLGGEAGQSPVFYNLLVACAGLLIVRAIDRPAFDARALALASVAMLAMGLSLQIKYSSVFEGMFFGCLLLWNAQRSGMRPLPLAAAAAGWIALALLPTMLAWAAYAAIGHGDAFVQANFLSILDRRGDGAAPIGRRLFWMIALLAPLLLAAWLARGSVGKQAAVPRRFVELWAAAAIGGVVLFGTFFDHYALPLLVPLCIAAAPLFGDPRAGLRLEAPGVQWFVPASVVLMIVATAISVPTINDNRRARGFGPQVAAMAGVIRPLLGNGCLFVFHGEPALYRLTGSCLPTRWPFPNHLNYTREAPAIGGDPLAEIRRIMATRPPVVVIGTRPEPEISPAAWRYMEAELARDYIRIFEVPVGTRLRLVYQRRPGR